jgi:large subunit ribosomal protein L10e
MHPYNVKLIAEEWSQIRDNALEACRMVITKRMDEGALGQYFIEVKVHPHHLLRENKSAAAVAGADRISTGMTQSFGVVVGRAGMVHAGKEIFFISCTNEKAARLARDTLIMLRSKVPCKTRVVFEKVK